MNKKIIIALSIIGVIIITIVFLLIYNNDTNKLKRYLKNKDYKCNSTICTKVDNNIQYQINYKKGIYRYDDQEIIIDINQDRTTVDVAKGATQVCTFAKNPVKDLTTFTENDTTSNCLIYLEKVNREVENFQTILVKSKADLAKLSK